MVLSQSLNFGLNANFGWIVFNYFLFLTFLSKERVSMGVDRLAVKRVKNLAVMRKF